MMIFVFPPINVMYLFNLHYSVTDILKKKNSAKSTNSEES